QHQARPIEHQTVIAANLVDHDDWNLVLSGDAGEHAAAKLTFPDPEWRRRDVEQEIAPGADQNFDWVKSIKLLGPELLIIPRVFADRQGHAIAAEGKQFLALGGREVTHLVEDVIGRKEHL